MRNTLFISGILWLVGGLSSAQAQILPTTPKPTPDSTGPKTYTYIERMPVFPVLAPGDSAVPSNQRFKRFINADVRYPPRALRDGVAGQVFFSFSVNGQGRTQDIKIVKGLRADVDAEVLRNAHRLDAIQWEPGTQNGRPVTVSFTAPINFNIDGKQLHQALSDSLDVGSFRKFVHPHPSWPPYNRLFDPQQGLVYGNCIQRLGFSSGGLSQHVRLVNLTTGKALLLEVKPLLRSRRENPFCYVVPPGRYALYRYEFAESKWYGAEMHEENVRKPKPAHSNDSLQASRYLFTVQPGKVHYVGTWHLEQENAPAFTDDKATLDAQLAPVFKYLNFAEAVTAVPK
ncbi:energy transducer TonB [Hymenobacter glacialis]|nr:energy transducer TonB [Hymenobacter glacialis]